MGDIFWVYQKLSLLFDRINLVICVIDLNCPVQTRSSSFIKLLPKIDKFKFKLVTRQYYNYLENLKKTIDEVLIEYESNVFVIEYAVNKWLEDGHRINMIDSYPLEESVAIKYKDISLPFNQYIVLYISGNKIIQEWQPEVYADLIHNIFRKYNIEYPIFLIGAKYDEAPLIRAGHKLQEYGYTINYFIENSLENIIYIIKNAKYFIGYQSGLSIIADNFDVPQTMIYFNYLENMIYTWPKQKNITMNIYNGITFKNNIYECINNIKLN